MCSLKTQTDTALFPFVRKSHLVVPWFTLDVSALRSPQSVKGTRTNLRSKHLRDAIEWLGCLQTAFSNADKSAVRAGFQRDQQGPVQARWSSELPVAFPHSDRSGVQLPIGQRRTHLRFGFLGEIVVSQGWGP